MPTMLVVAGVNGAGKSSNIEKTRVEEYINPDKIAKEFAEKHPDQNQLRAMKGVLDRVNANIAQKKDFAIETTLASRTALNQMKRAKDAGFEVQLNYVALDTVERHVERVASRVAKGGHDISREDIERRFRTSYENLPKAIELADKVNIFDNSDKLKPVLQIDRGKILQESRNMPDHLKSHLYSLNRMTLRDKEKGREFQTNVTFKRFGEKDIYTQKREAASNYAKRIGPNSGKLAARFESLPKEALLQSLSNKQTLFLSR